jgi:ketosteroid isomerase-like protein
MPPAAVRTAKRRSGWFTDRRLPKTYRTTISFLGEAGPLEDSGARDAGGWSTRRRAAVIMLAVTVEEDVQAANASFYAAFEARDLAAMTAVWDASDRARVTHPGWATLSGWAKVSSSWQAIFANTPFIQFVLTDEQVVVVGGVAIVTNDENILQGAGSPDGGATDTGELSGARVAATNVFVLEEGVWRMVLHHGSAVSATAAA